MSPPPSFRDWREYVEDVEFNPARASLTNDEIDALRQILGRRTDRIRTLQEEAARHLGALVDIKVHQGDCQVVDRGAEIRPESGHMVALNISHDGLRRVVRVYPGDYAPLDLAYADMWTQYRLGQEEIKALLVQH